MYGIIRTVVTKIPNANRMACLNSKNIRFPSYSQTSGTVTLPASMVPDENIAMVVSRIFEYDNRIRVASEGG